MPEKRTIFITTLLVLLLASVLLLAAGYPSTHGPFYLDSEAYFRGLPYFQEPSLSWSKIRKTIWENPYPGGRRWIPNLTYLVENRVAGLTPASGRIVGLLIHSLNFFLVFFLLRRVLILMGRGDDPATVVAALGALLWGLNPFHSETVLYVIQRMTLLCTTFYLAAAILYLRGKGTAGPARWVWMALAGLCALLSIISKENGVLIVVGITVLELVLPARPINRQREGEEKAAKALGLVRSPIFVLVLFSGLVGIMFLLLGYDPVQIVKGIFSPNQAREFTPWERLLTQGRVLVSYLGLLLFPLPQHLSLVMKYPLSRSLISPPLTMVAWALVIGLVVTAFRRRRDWPLFSLAVLWFFGNHVIESTILSLEIAFAHRNYLPSVFLFLPAADWMAGGGVRRSGYRWAASVLVLILFLLGVNARARVWGNPEVFWKDVIRKAPGSLRGYINLGILYDLQGRESEALDTYQAGSRAAFEEKPGFWGDLYCNMGMALMDLGRNREAEPWLDRALSITLNQDYLYNMARLQGMLGNREKVAKTLSLLETRNPIYPRLHMLKALFFLEGGDRDSARREAMEELRLYPNNREAHMLLETIGGK